MTRAKRNLVYQALVLLLSFAAVALVGATAAANLESRGIELGLEFLGDRAGFALSETWLPYSPDDSNLWALLVGVGNTLMVTLLVAVLSTAIGAGLGILRISDNPLSGGFARAWVEFSRNTPPILLLLFLYSLLGHALPVDRAVSLGAGIHLSLRGLAVPALDLGGQGHWLLLALLGGLAGLFFVGRAARSRQQQTGIRPPWQAISAGVLAALLAGWLLGPGPGVQLDLPVANGPDLSGGLILTPEFFTLIVGLSVYTSGFIAEIVRTGLQSITLGQWEAASALGLSRGQTLRLVIVPQMLRVIIPPMTSQYVNIVKNSTLVIAIGYADFMVTAGTMINKTSRAVEGTLIIIAVYLLINLALAAVMNHLNRSFERA
ncbi:MAG: ABC transporter permease subunit [Beijerinckiaceae bacterium]|jgi:general L-amino acid transport system permease protein|nr:ABC transporter permease subunit [Beijerinckiaceae bacterium]